MKKQPVGLVIEGNSTSSVLLRLSGLVSSLGPIKSTGFQVARRVSNFLKGGFAARSYTELEVARVVLIRAPDQSISRIVDEIIEAGLNHSHHCFILCETWAPTALLKPLQDRGASIASLVLLPTGADKLFAVEGDGVAVRQLSRLLERAEVTTVELKADTKHLLCAAMTLGSVLPVTLLALSQQALREAGLTGNQLFSVVQQVSHESIACFLRSPRVTGNELLAEPGANQDFYWKRLTYTHPELARQLRHLIDSLETPAIKKVSRGHGA